MNSAISLENLSKLLNKTVYYGHANVVPYIQINERWVITQNSVTNLLELNDLETYTWQEIGKEDLTELVMAVSRLPT